MIESRLVYYYFLLKILDLTDTVRMSIQRRFITKYLNFASGFYSPEEKQQTVVISPLLSSLLHLIRSLYRVKVDSRRTSSCFGNHKYLGSQHHVLLLLHDSIQARAEKVYMVEEIHYSSTDFAIRFHSATHPQHCSGQRL